MILVPVSWTPICRLRRRSWTNKIPVESRHPKSSGSSCSCHAAQPDSFAFLSPSCFLPSGRIQTNDNAASRMFWKTRDGRRDHPLQGHGRILYTFPESDCTQIMSEPCIFECVCYFYKGFPFSGSPIWWCGNNVMVGPCIHISFIDMGRIQQTWLGTPTEELTRQVMDRA